MLRLFISSYLRVKSFIESIAFLGRVKIELAFNELYFPCFLVFDRKKLGL